MHNMNFASLYGMRPVFPRLSCSKIVERIKDSDFLVMDTKCVRRMVGLKFDEKTMKSPRVTFTASRGELPFAKQQAFSLGKKIFYNNKVCSVLFKYFVGDFISPNDYYVVAELYSKFILEKKPKTPRIDISRNHVEIKGHCFKPFFALTELIAVLGEPDEKIEPKRGVKHKKVYYWEDWGLKVFTDALKNNHVHKMRIQIHALSDSNRPPFLGNLLILGEKYDSFEHGEISFKKIRKNYIAVIPHESTDEYERCKSLKDATWLEVVFMTEPSPFWEAVRDNDIEKARALIEEGADLNERGGYYLATPLINAIWNNSFEMAKLLIESGANLNLIDFDGLTPLMHAVLDKEKAPIAKLLIQSGCDTSVMGENGKTALDVARENGVEI